VAAKGRSGIRWIWIGASAALGLALAVIAWQVISRRTAPARSDEERRRQFHQELEELKAKQQAEVRRAEEQAASEDFVLTTVSRAEASDPQCGDPTAWYQYNRDQPGETPLSYSIYGRRSEQVARVVSLLPCRCGAVLDMTNPFGALRHGAHCCCPRTFADMLVPISGNVDGELRFSELAVRHLVERPRR
jgi:hypothetical protein